MDKNESPEKGLPDGKSFSPIVKQERAAGWGVFWWSLSFVLHAAAILSLVYFTPMREYIFGKDLSDPLKDVTPEEVRRVAKSLIDIAEKHVRRDVLAMQKMLDYLRDARDKRYRFYADQVARGGRTQVKPLETLGIEGPDVKGDPEATSLFGLYDMAQGVESNCYGVYRQMKTVELARIQQLDLLEAFENTKIAMPVHAPIDHVVFTQRIAHVRDGNLAALKKELFRIRSETADMLASVQRFKDIAEGLISDKESGYVYVIAPGLEASGSGTRWGASVGPPLSPLEIFPAGEGNMPAGFLPPTGRKIMAGARKSDWMAIDTWYIIGPFPNPKREYMDKKFPPESIVDLDQVYVGKNNVKLEWQWVQTDGYWPISPPLVDRFAIWYAFTEIWCEKEQTKVCLFGSDDYSKCWINGELIYTSGKDPHHWIPDRGFQKVLFRKGFNQVLMKLENAGGTTGFSMCVYLGDV